MHNQSITLQQEDELIRRAYVLKERLHKWYQHKSLDRAATELPEQIQAMLLSEIQERETRGAQGSYSIFPFQQHSLCIPRHLRMWSAF